MALGCSIENHQSKIFNGSPLSCRWRLDQHPCCPSLTIGGIRDRRFQFFLYALTSGHECVLQRAMLRTRIVWTFCYTILDVQFRQLEETCGGDCG